MYTSFFNGLRVLTKPGFSSFQSLLLLLHFLTYLKLLNILLTYINILTYPVLGQQTFLNYTYSYNNGCATYNLIVTHHCMIIVEPQAH